MTSFCMSCGNQLAEKLIVGTLPKMATMAHADAQARALDGYMLQTKERMHRLELIFKLVEHAPNATMCPAMEGILAEADELIGIIEDHDARDAAIVAAVQSVKHYLLVRYTTLLSWADLLGKSDLEKLLRATLDAESRLNKDQAKVSTLGDRLTELFDRKT